MTRFSYFQVKKVVFSKVTVDIKLSNLYSIMINTKSLIFKLNSQLEVNFLSLTKDVIRPTRLSLPSEQVDELVSGPTIQLPS